MKDELPDDKRKEWARNIYIREDKSYRDIALTVGADEAEVRNWGQEGAWAGMKRSLLVSKRMQLELFYGQLEKISNKLREDEGPSPKDIENMVKFTTAIKNLETELAVSTIIEVSELFIQWLKRKDLKLTRKLVIEFDAFIKEKVAA